MQSTWVVLIPPIAVVLLAATTRRVFLSLFTGIISALLIIHNFAVAKVVPELITRIWQTTELHTLASWQSFWGAWYLFICLFLLILGVLITLLRASGGAYAYGNFVLSYVNSAKGVELSALFLSLFFFIDDYFSCLTVGSVMQTITDKFKIPRIKLGLLVNTMAAPLVVLLPVSSWVAEIIMQLKQSGVSTSIQKGACVIGDPFFVYTQMIPFLFYSFIIIASIWYLVIARVSYGVVNKHEQIAQKTGNLFAGKVPAMRKIKPLSPDIIASSSLVDFVVPIGTLFVTVFLAVLYFGSWSLLGGTRTLLGALQNTQVAAALFVGSVITLVFTLLLLLVRQKITCRQLPEIFFDGIDLMGKSVCILILIWTLSTLIKSDLKTGQYLAHILLGHVSISLLPLMFFLVGALTASSMGSAWGTLGILIPIGVPMLVSMTTTQNYVHLQDLTLLYPLLGAIVSGAVVGNHMSPISDTMLMSSTSAGAYHIDLVRAQLSLTVPTIVSTSMAFLVSGFIAPWVAVWTNVMISLIIGLAFNIGIMKVMQSLTKKEVL